MYAALVTAAYVTIVTSSESIVLFVVLLVSDPEAGQVSAQLIELARCQRMNTNVRRMIFYSIMQSEVSNQIL